MPRSCARSSRQKKSFAWLKRQVTPEERDAVYNLGIPGVGYVNERRRVYPQGRLGVACGGLRRSRHQGHCRASRNISTTRARIYTASLAEPEEHRSQPAQMSVDIRVQSALIDELSQAIAKFRAIAAGGIVLDITTGEVISMVSLPDFNPNQEKKNFSQSQQNQMTSGVYELGSVIKAVTFAMAFDYGTANLQSRYDARFPLVIGNARINDYHAKRAVLSVPEIFTNSSNIGTAKMALEVGMERHQAFLRRVGLFDRLQTELPESARPLLPRHWSKLATATAAFGHGFAVQPLQGAAVVAGLLNGGHMMTPTLLKRSEERRAGDGPDDRQAGDQRDAALSVPPQRDRGHGVQGRRHRLSRRRQDRHGRKGGRWPLFQGQASELLHRRVPDGQAEVPAAGDARRTEGDAGYLWLRHVRLECRSDWRERSSSALHRCWGSSRCSRQRISRSWRSSRKKKKG